MGSRPLPKGQHRTRLPCGVGGDKGLRAVLTGTAHVFGLINQHQAHCDAAGVALAGAADASVSVAGAAGMEVKETELLTATLFSTIGDLQQLIPVNQQFNTAL